MMNIQLHNTIYRGGGGVPMVLVHAFPVDHRMWDECARQIITLADTRGLDPFPVWAPDMPGAGDAPVPGATMTGRVAEDGAYVEALDLIADGYVSLLNAAGCDQAVWVGLSMGGYVVMDVQRRHPRSVAGLALCDTTTHADSPQARDRRLGVARQCVLQDTLEPVMHFARPEEHDSTVKKGHRFQGLLSGWIRQQTPDGIAWRERMAAGRPDLTDQLPQVTAPTAIISGENDPSSPPERMHELEAAMTGTQVDFTAIQDCGHFSAVEHPDAVAAALVDLVARMQGR
jgi:pimeloyl-ACP methyl ester carboxylesterase